MEGGCASAHWQVTKRGVEKGGEMSKPGGRETGDQRRAARLAEQLRANLMRRKAQTRARRDGAPDLRPEGIGAAEEAEAAESGGDDGE